ncbi:type II toxin-antitoxin system VapC family toxin [Candidatus Woesearchaeota archaeon]|nr:type II toxin-antitoxin system VapC family toxin [Candidatus Woesearchaeota archaeon]
MFLLDSSVILEIINDTKKSKDIIPKLKGELLTTPFSIYEIFLGLKRDELFILEKLLNALKVINFDTNSSLIAVQIMKKLTDKGEKINLVDIFMASIAVSNDLTLVSLDNDFKNINNLKTVIF